MGSANAGRLKALASEKGRHRIDDGLCLFVRDEGKPLWVFRYVAVSGKRRDMAIGPFESMSLPDARAEIQRWKSERQAGRDPIEVRKAAAKASLEENRKATSLREYAKEYHALQIGVWKNDKHAAQWLNSLEHLGPLLDKPIREITSASLLTVLESLNCEHHETATRIRQRVEAVYDRAIIAGIVEANPAAPLKRALRAPAKKSHHASMSYKDLPGFVRRLRDSDGAQSTRLAFEWMILACARTNEVLQATWQQINEDRTKWTIAAEHMKSGEEHEVHITARMREILTAIEAQRGEGWEWIFPSAQGRKNAMSNGAFLAVLKRMGLNGKVTPHGMRATFSTWAYERSRMRGEIIEAALSHQESNAVKAAYNRADYWQQRVELADAWSAYCQSMPQS